MKWKLSMTMNNWKEREYNELVSSGLESIPVDAFGTRQTRYVLHRPVNKIWYNQFADFKSRPLGVLASQEKKENPAIP